MTAARRTALISVGAAALLIALKVSVGVATNSLGLISEAVHSGTDLVAALVTFIALGVAHRPADQSHAWGHGKAEHLSALGEAAILAAAGGVIIWQAIRRLTGAADNDVDATWYAFAVIGVVIVVDAARMIVSLRAARRYTSPALLGNAVHFGADLVGTFAVLVGLLATRAGYPEADAIAALFVAGLILIAAWRLAAANIHVLMDRTPVVAERAARAAITSLRHDLVLRRLRVRAAAGRHFVDAVIAVSPSAALAEGHSIADEVEEAVRRALPGADVVVHVEPGESLGTLPERALAAALTVPGAREIHNVRVLQAGHRTEVSLHLKCQRDASLHDAHALADRVEAAISAALPEVDTVTTHLEPLSTVDRAAAALDTAEATASVERIVAEIPGAAIRELRMVHTDDGLVAFLTLALPGGIRLVEAHELAGSLRRRVRAGVPGLADVFVHTEPGGA